MHYRDLRTWLRQVEEMGELKTIKGANWDLEIGVLAEHVMRANQQPAVVFDQIVDYPAGYRILVNESGSRKRAALTLGLSTELDEPGLINAWREKRRSLRPIPPQYVEEGPILENVLKDGDIDMWKFPTPRWHEHDGGRYLGTGDAIITRDRENDSLNMGTYRVMVHDRGHIFVYISPSKDGRIHRDKWFAKNEPMPVVAIFGSDPLLHMVASWGLPHGQFEMEFAGGIKGEPIRVIKGPVTGLPIPADAEIVVEGFVMQDERKPEGPFGEWTGYYGSGSREEPVVQVKALYHRNDPVILGSPPVKPPSGKVYMQSILRSAAIYEQLEAAGIPGVKGVWFHEVGGGHMLNVISIQQLYPGHAKQAASIVCQSRGGAYMGRYVIVVDEDINPRDLEDVMWAVCTRSDPAQDIDIIRRCLSGPLDPVISPERKKNRDFGTSRAIIDATRPFEWRNEFPRVSESSPELKEKVLAKWQSQL